MAYITTMNKLNNLYVCSPHLIEEFYATCERIIASGIEVIFTAGNEESKVINTIDGLKLYRISIEVGIWSVFD
ncbi:hypothetical protein [Dyadobacter sp. CY326]|uniref:hypothetical protein n=1 Tax=Dyadobacter sp. CY326 TaxID=2907300 RepID=UPI001F2170B0|nr:hypothetical protein [Dyadobacter sp. CY326]